MANKIPIDPAFLDIDASLTAAVEKYLAELDASQLADMGLLSVEPTIPATETEIDECINGWVFLYDPEDAADAAELKTELHDIAQSFSLSIDINLPLEQFQSRMQVELKSLGSEQLLTRGVFGRETSAKDIQETKKIVIACSTSMCASCTDEFTWHCSMQSLIHDLSDGCVRC